MLVLPKATDEKYSRVFAYLCYSRRIDKSIINVGNYVRIKTKEGEKSGNYIYGKYISYSIYLFDVETLTLYYMHNNNWYKGGNLKC